jgi:diacylglycerol kinase
MIKKTFGSFVCAVKGMVTVFKEERNFSIILFFAVVASAIGYYFDFTLIEFSICALIITVVLVAEMVNTAIEDLCNKIEPNQDPVIGKIKDISSGFVLLASIGAGVAGLFVFFNHFTF